MQEKSYSSFLFLLFTIKIKYLPILEAFIVFHLQLKLKESFMIEVQKSY